MPPDVLLALLCLPSLLNCSITIRLIRELNTEIEDIESAIQTIMEEMRLHYNYPPELVSAWAL